MKTRNLFSALLIMLAMSLGMPSVTFAHPHPHRPHWVDVRCCDASTRYIFFPENNFYYDLEREVYIYPSGGVWLFSYTVPAMYAAIDLAFVPIIELDIRIERPFIYNHDHMVWYRSYYNDYDYVRYYRGHGHGGHYAHYNRPYNRHAHAYYDRHDHRDYDRHDHGNHYGHYKGGDDNHQNGGGHGNNGHGNNNHGNGNHKNYDKKGNGNYANRDYQHRGSASGNDRKGNGGRTGNGRGR